MKLPRIVEQYVDASNRRDVNSIVACFSNNGVVEDEEETLRGKDAIAGWAAKTIEKYKFHFNPLDIKEHAPEVIVVMEVSGTFDGSPITLDYRFTIANDEIVSLTIS